MTPILRNPPPTQNLPVCIIGAGMAGLYTAMIFESLGISYQIVDADKRERVGGRLFTYHFPKGGPYDYYDVGGMRFPDTPFMKRTFDLARNRGLNVNLIPYIVQMVNPPNTWLFYNNARVNNQDSSVAGDPFDIQGYVTDQSLTTPQGAHKRVAEILQPFRDLFRPRQKMPPPDIADAIRTLFEETDKFSVRSYMFVNGMSDQDVHWCETLDKSGTGWYDRSLTQAVVESIAFDWPTTPLPGPEESKDPNAGWYCFDGGSSTLPHAMFASLPQKRQQETLFNSPVTAISRDPTKEVMRISIKGVETPQEYSAVISTVPLPRLSFMDLTGVNINDNYAQWSAIRVLQYGSAVKVGIRFSTPWWETELPQPIHGGQSYTDRPVRTVVYPSYPKGAKPEEMSKALIVSYCGIQDAERLGAFIHHDGTAEPELVDQVLRDLADIHGVTVPWLKKYYTGEYFAWDWLRDPLTMGAFAVFGPGVYTNGDVYSAILQPAAHGKLFFAGEAASACHSWVAGALDSAWRAVDQYLALNHPDTPLQTKFWELWGRTEYWDELFNEDLVKLNRDLADRHLVISLYKDGVTLEQN